MKNQDLIELLAQRSSMRFVTAPAPSDEELAIAFQAAMAAPDHGKLVPWRFKIIRQEHIKAFADFAFNIRQNSDNPLSEDKLNATKAWLSEVPLLIAVGAHIDYNSKVPELERTLSVGCATMNLINALQLMGYGVFWSTGIATFFEEFQTGLGFDPLDYRFMGFLVVGTPKMSIPKKERASYTEVVSEWTAPEV